MQLQERTGPLACVCQPHHQLAAKNKVFFNLKAKVLQKVTMTYLLLGRFQVTILKFLIFTGYTEEVVKTVQLIGVGLVCIYDNPPDPNLTKCAINNIQVNRVLGFVCTLGFYTLIYLL